MPVPLIIARPSEAQGGCEGRAEVPGLRASAAGLRGWGRNVECPRGWQPRRTPLRPVLDL